MATPTRGQDVPGIALLHGPEEYRRREQTRAIVEAVRRAKGDADVVTFDGSTTSAADVLDECRSFGLIAAHKVVVVDNAADLVKEENRPLFERYAQGLAEAASRGEEPSATLVLRGSTWHRGKLDAMIEAVGRVVACEHPSRVDAVQWAMKRARDEYQRSLAANVAEALVERVGASLQRLDNELGKLAVASGGGAASGGAASGGAASGGAGSAITMELVSQFVGVMREEEAWAVQGDLASGSAAEALGGLRHALDVSRLAEQQLIWNAMDLTRKLYGVAMARRGLGPMPKLWGEDGKRIEAAGSRLTPESALALFRLAVRTDLRNKTGLGDLERGLECLAVSVALATDARAAKPVARPSGRA